MQKKPKVDVATGIENANKIEVIRDLKSGEQVIAAAPAIVLIEISSPFPKDNIRSQQLLQR